jgi:hypothetical protein
MNKTPLQLGTRIVWGAVSLVAVALLVSIAGTRAAAQAKKPPKGQPPMAPLIPMEQVGPRPIRVDTKAYARVIHVGPAERHQSVAGALASITDASAERRYAILVAAGTYREVSIRMKPYVDLYGGFPDGDWKNRDVHQNATILDAQKKGPVVLGANHARLDGFVITGGEQAGHGGGIVCDGVSPVIVNNIIAGNNTLGIKIKEGLGKQIGHEGGGIALLSGSRAQVCNNLFCENTTSVGAGAAIAARGNVHGKILRNVFCNNIAGVKDDQMYHGRVGTRSSPGAAIALAEESAPQISFNVMVLGEAALNNDGGGIWVEGNSMPLISYNWIAGNLSGDDGGGIYVMGNLYYDDEGKRHDSSPDGPVLIEDNLIAGNNTVRGAPGGVRVSRFGRAELRRNIIVGNEKGGAHGAEGGVITVMENNLITDNGFKKTPAKPAFRLTGEVTGSKFSERQYVTEFATGKSLGTEDLSGSVVRIGKQWSVVKSSSPSGLVLWGKITDKGAKVEVLDRYVQAK